MLTSQMIKDKAKELGATLCGIGKVYDEQDKGKDPFMILPSAKCIIGFGFAVPKGLYKAMENGNHYYAYANIGVKHIDEEFAEIFLLKMGGMIEDAGYDACLQKNVPNLKIKGDKTTNPEVSDTYELVHAVAVEEGKPCPDVIIDFGKAAKACGLGEVGLSGKILNKKYGPFMRYCFIITDAPLECDEELREHICDNCGECIKACPGKAISEDGLDSWQCSVYYKGAHKSNPFVEDGFLEGRSDREEILDGKARFDSETAREIYNELDFLPKTRWGYVPSLCGKKCDIACYKHLIGEL